MKYVAGLRFFTYLIDEFGFVGLFYFIIALAVLLVINMAISLIPAGAAKLLSDDADTAKGVFVISVVILCIIELILYLIS